jgi:hypothetical protein
MSYAKAVKHRPHRLNIGHTFNTGSGHWPSPWANPKIAPLLWIREWWPRRHNQHTRECIREKIAEAKMVRDT